MGLIKFTLSSLIKNNLKFNRQFSQMIPRKPPWKVLFFGTDEFSIYSLKALCEEYRKGLLLNKLEVVTTIKGKPNAVKTFADKEKLHLHKWPPNFGYSEFDVGLVVSFGHLIPEHIIEKFEFGMLNVHASLLPRWRGAAPIIYAIAKGDTQTGITIMKISPKKFDIGEIVLQESVPISPHMKMGELFKILGTLGAQNLVKTLEALPENLNKALPQPTTGVVYAPKVTPEFATVKWNTMTSLQIYNLGRSLDGVFHLQTTWNNITVKLINIKQGDASGQDYHKMKAGFVNYDKQKKILKILCSDFKLVIVEKIGVVGKKIMTAQDFNNGYIKKEPPDCRYFQ